MSGLSTRATWALTRLRWGDCGQPAENGWYRAGQIGNVGRKTIIELLDHPELEWGNVPSAEQTHAYRWGQVKVRLRKEAPVETPAYEHHMVFLLEQILAVLKDRL